MHEGPADTEDRILDLWHQQEGFDDIRQHGFRPGKGLPSLAYAADPVKADKVCRHDAGEEPPDRIDAGQPGKQEVARCAKTRPVALGDDDHDET